MMHQTLLILAAICFVLATVGTSVPRLNFMGLGLLLLTIAMLVS